MPSLYQPWCRDDPYDARIKNLRKARSSPRYHPPRPWRSKEESHMIRRFVWQWFTCRDRNKPSARDWARQLGISHVWLLKLVRKFIADPSEMQEEARLYGEPTLAQLSGARECTREMKERGELRPTREEKAEARRQKWAEFLKRHPDFKPSEE